jgi:uncharacterized lipoprotein YajG
MKIIRKDFLKAILAIALLIAVVLISGCSKKEKNVIISVFLSPTIL